MGVKKIKKFFYNIKYGLDYKVWTLYPLLDIIGSSHYYNGNGRMMRKNINMMIICSTSKSPSPWGR